MTETMTGSGCLVVLVGQAQLVVWEHVYGRFYVLINIIDVCMMSEVVWKFFLLLFALLFAKSFLFGVCVFWLQKTCAQCTTSSLGACVRQVFATN